MIWSEDLNTASITSRVNFVFQQNENLLKNAKPFIAAFQVTLKELLREAKYYQLGSMVTYLETALLGDGK